MNRTAKEMALANAHRCTANDLPCRLAASPPPWSRAARRAWAQLRRHMLVTWPSRAEFFSKPSQMYCTDLNPLPRWKPERAADLRNTTPTYPGFGRQYISVLQHTVRILPAYHMAYHIAYHIAYHVSTVGGNGRTAPVPSAARRCRGVYPSGYGRTQQGGVYTCTTCLSIRGARVVGSMGGGPCQLS